MNRFALIPCALILTTSLLALEARASVADTQGVQGVAAAEREYQHAVAWLEKMGTALREQSYHGTFIYMRGKRFDTVEVTHQFKNGQEVERLKNLSGVKREIIRQDDEAVCLQAEGESDALQPLSRGPFTHAFNQLLKETLDHYRIGVHGVGRIADRSAVRVSVLPKNSDRYGYQLWLDEETGLLLRSNLVNKGRVLELFQFTEVSIGEPIDEGLLHASVDATADCGFLTPTQMAQLEKSNAPSSPNWKVNWVPQGFRQVREAKGGGMVFTDGVATVSVFVEKRTGKSLGNMQTQVGGTVVLSKPIKDSEDQITVVGEVPFATAKRLAESVEPVIY